MALLSGSIRQPSRPDSLHCLEHDVQGVDRCCRVTLKRVTSKQVLFRGAFMYAKTRSPSDITMLHSIASTEI